MFWYRFVRRRRRRCRCCCCRQRQQTYVRASTFGFLSFLAGLVVLTYRIRVIQDQMWNLQFLGPTWFDCKHMDWTLSLKGEHLVWPWLWPRNYKELLDIDRGHFKCRGAVDWFSFLTYWSGDKMGAFMQTTFSSLLSLWKLFWRTVGRNLFITIYSIIKHFHFYFR